jgi:hypothetical protein
MASTVARLFQSFSDKEAGKFKRIRPQIFSDHFSATFGWSNFVIFRPLIFSARDIFWGVILVIRLKIWSSGKVIASLGSVSYTD